MIATIIAALIGNYMTTCFVIGLVVAGSPVLRQRGRADSTAGQRAVPEQLHPVGHRHRAGRQLRHALGVR